VMFGLQRASIPR